jgi:hypothetical protein
MFVRPPVKRKITGKIHHKEIHDKKTSHKRHDGRHGAMFSIACNIFIFINKYCAYTVCERLWIGVPYRQSTDQSLSFYNISIPEILK